MPPAISKLRDARRRMALGLYVLRWLALAVMTGLVVSLLLRLL